MGKLANSQLVQSMSLSVSLELSAAVKFEKSFRLYILAIACFWFNVLMVVMFGLKIKGTDMWINFVCMWEQETRIFFVYP